MSQLQINLREILRQKTTYLLPANIKKDVTILEVTGTYEGQPPALQSKSVTITENGLTTVSADSGYDGLSSVAISAQVGEGGPITQEEYNIDEELARSILEDFTPYTELEYIESTGTQCIDTSYYPTQNTKVVMKMETSGIAQGQTAFNAFGTTGTDSRFGWWTYFSGSSYFRYGIQSSTRDSKVDVTGDFTNTSFIVTLDRSVAKIETPNDTLEYSIIPTDNFTLDVSLILGGNHWDGGATIGNMGAIYKLYYCKIYENSVLVKDYIPVINRLNDKVGVYDKISNTFLYASGTGEFIAGGVVNANVTT